jgi:hypothetical protein
VPDDGIDGAVEDAMPSHVAEARRAAHAFCDFVFPAASSFERQLRVRQRILAAISIISVGRKPQPPPYERDRLKAPTVATWY